MASRHRVSIARSVATETRIRFDRRRARRPRVRRHAGVGPAGGAGRADSARLRPPRFRRGSKRRREALQNNPRLKGLNQQQRVERVDFVVGNTLVLLLHEIGHVIITSSSCRCSAARRMPPIPMLR